LKILLIGDIVGRPGREAVTKILPELRKDKCIDFVIANAENIAGGSGLTPDTVDELLNSHVDVVTSGDHIWKKKEIYERLEKDKRVLGQRTIQNHVPASVRLLSGAIQAKSVL